MDQENTASIIIWAQVGERESWRRERQGKGQPTAAKVWTEKITIDEGHRSHSIHQGCQLLLSASILSSTYFSAITYLSSSLSHLSAAGSISGPRTSHCFSSSSHCIELLKRTLHLLTTPSVTSEWVLFVFLIPLNRIVRKKFALLLEYLIHIILFRVFGKFWQVGNIWQVINKLGEFWHCNQHAFICHEETVSLVDQVINISLQCHAMFL